ncbi:MAG: UDP-N-acetylmuramate:L-alanyl-gamma-D-glutamyl-meso-diaminopimelate ligase [Gammaproteobacteria bacterium]
MKIHILGICGTFMGGLALLARELGHEVSGSDANIYPPMSTQLEQSGIRLYQDYGIESLQQEKADVHIIGNALSRGNAAVEYILNEGLAYSSGPQWLADNVLPGRHVMAISGTHGKTSCTSMLAWVLECVGKAPGFLIGGIAENFGVSARSGQSGYFVIEADEYDTAFFDKRSKFIHYRPRTLVINNIEFDHADIFGDIDAIIREFSRMIRTVPKNGLIVCKHDDPQIRRVLASGCWTPTIGFGAEGAEWQVRPGVADYSRFEILHQGKIKATVNWGLIGRHNAENALAVTVAADHIGISAPAVAEALASYQSVKRRLQVLAEVNGVTIYDDFAHHPTAFKATLSALRAKVGQARIIAVFEPRSNTMKLGVHQDTLAASLEDADTVLALEPDGLSWDLHKSLQGVAGSSRVFSDTDQIIRFLGAQVKHGDHVLIMSNGSFDAIHQRLIESLAKPA